MSSPSGLKNWVSGLGGFHKRWLQGSQRQQSQREEMMALNEWQLVLSCSSKVGREVTARDTRLEAKGWGVRRVAQDRSCKALLPGLRALFAVTWCSWWCGNRPFLLEDSHRLDIYISVYSQVWGLCRCRAPSMQRPRCLTVLSCEIQEGVGLNPFLLHGPANELRGLGADRSVMLWPDVSRSTVLSILDIETFPFLNGGGLGPKARPFLKGSLMFCHWEWQRSYAFKNRKESSHGIGGGRWACSKDSEFQWIKYRRWDKMVDRDCHQRSKCSYTRKKGEGSVTCADLWL